MARDPSVSWSERSGGTTPTRDRAERPRRFADAVARGITTSVVIDRDRLSRRPTASAVGTRRRSVSCRGAGAGPASSEVGAVTRDAGGRLGDHRSRARPGTSRARTRPPRRSGHAPRCASRAASTAKVGLRDDRAEDAAGSREPNPRGVSGRNTPQGPSRRKPPGSWKTTEADRSGAGPPRRGSAESPERERGWPDRARPSVRAGGRTRGNTSNREVDCSGWERRRGEESCRRRDGASGRPIVGRPGATDRRADEVLEGACKVMGGSPTPLATAGSATWRKTPGSRSRGPRTQAES
jgi:hypothetical protein